jgi:hypothetical protein
LDQLHVFVSVGGTASAAQEAFISAVEDRLKSEGMIPHTIGRNTFSTDAPLKAVTNLMNTCSGTVVIALERTYFPSGIDKRGGPKESPLANVILPTPWNQIEAAMAYSKGHPLMVIVEEGLKSEGLLEKGYDWYVQSVRLTPASLATPEFNGVLASWKEQVSARKVDASNTPVPQAPKAATDMTIGELVSGMRPSQLWSLLGTLAALVAGAFALGAKLIK